MSKEKVRSEEKLSFQAEVSRLLDIVANALYSNKEIFLRELISNASDACDKLRYAAITQPELTAEDPDFKITLSTDKKARRLSVADNGIGMTHEGVTKALKPFEQAHNPRSREHKGTGLGLHLCDNFMKLFGGSLEIESKAGEGTTVTVTFPAERALGKRSA